MFSHRACMAHIQSPVFCPNDTSSLAFSGLPLQSATASSDLDTPHAFENEINDHEHEEDEDDEAGGVSLAMPPHDYPDTTHDTPIFITHDVHTTTIPTQQSMSPPAAMPQIMRPPPRTHPRPETRDISEEEDGRRVRLALEGDSSQEPPRFDMLAAISHGFGNHMPDNRTDSPPSIAQTLLPQVHQLPPDLRARLQDILPLARSLPAVQATRPADEMQIDEDALGVDDPRRNYDFADSMDLWRLRSIRYRSLPPFVPGLQSSVRLGRPVEEVARKTVAAGKTDMQGIRWDLIGPSRKDALAARRFLHPSRCSGRSLSQKRSNREEETQFQFRSFLPAHKAKFNHYQLRNVLAASSRNQVFYSTGRQVQQASLTCPNHGETVMDLSKSADGAADFKITCLAASARGAAPDYQVDQFLVAGGFYGEFALLNLDQTTSEVSQGYVTHAYNGLVTHAHTFADRRSGLIKAAFCSNDRKVRLMDVGSLRFTHEFTYDSAINCAATSPDGRLRVLAGDSREVLITDAERGQPLVTLREHSDHCFACDWSPDGRYVAAASQDGTTVIWDARNWKQPWSVQDCVTSCPRSVKFTDSGALVVAENDDVVSVYEGPLYQRRQDIRFFGSIAGVALLDGGAEITVANADKTVGGLLTFQRSSMGLGNGSYGKQLAPAGDRWSVRRTAPRPHYMAFDTHK